MFYFRDKGGAALKRKRKTEQQEMGKKSKQSKADEKQKQMKTRRK